MNENTFLNDKQGNREKSEAKHLLAVRFTAIPTSITMSMTTTIIEVMNGLGKPSREGQAIPR